ncbi:MAG TPA: O-antigen ligase family protein [Chloroflexota bacterium]
MHDARGGLTLHWSNPVVGIALALVGGVAVGAVVTFASPLVGLGALLGIAAALSMLTSAYVAVLVFVGVATLLPFAVIPVRLGVQLTVVDATLATGLLVMLLGALHRREPLVNSPVNAPLLVFVGLAVTSFVLGTAYSITPELVRLFLKLVNALLFFFTTINAIRRQDQLLQIARALMLGGFAAALIALALYVVPRDLAIRALSALRPIGYPSGPDVLRFIAGTEVLRATGTSLDPNVLGGLLLVTTALVITQLMSPTPLLRRSWLAVMVGAMLVAIVLTYSRSSWLGLASAVLLLAVVRYRRTWALALAGAAVLLLAPPGEMIIDRLTSGLLAQDKAAAMRLGEYKDAFRLISEYPIFGVGFGEAPRIDLYVAVSSIYLLVAEEMGLVGLSVYLITVGTALYHGLSALPRVADNRVKDVLVGLIVALGGALVAGLFDHYFINHRFPHMVALFWLYVGLVVVAVRLGAGEAKGQPAEGGGARS